MGRGKFKGKPTGVRQFSTIEDLTAGISAPPRTFGKAAARVERKEKDSSDEDFDAPKKGKGLQGIIEIENPNYVKPKTSLKARDIDIDKNTELSRREREELEKQKAHERYVKMQEQGKTERARKDLERLTLIRQEREEANRKREEQKAAKEAKKAEACK